jgi:hypothetical protein
MALIPLIWAQAILPGMIAAWVLFVPGGAELAFGRRRRAASRLPANRAEA